MDLLLLPGILSRNNGLALSFCPSHSRKECNLFHILTNFHFIFQIKLRHSSKIALCSKYFWCEGNAFLCQCGDFKFWAPALWFHWVIMWVRAGVAGTLKSLFSSHKRKNFPSEAQLKFSIVVQNHLSFLCLVCNHLLLDWH